MWGNCWGWAFPKWLRSYFQGKTLVIRKSISTWAPHAMLTDCIKELEIQEFIPQKRIISKNKILSWFPIYAVVFKGKIRKGKANCLCPNCINDKAKEIDNG